MELAKNLRRKKRRRILLSHDVKIEKETPENERERERDREEGMR